MESDCDCFVDIINTDVICTVVYKINNNVSLIHCFIAQITM